MATVLTAPLAIIKINEIEVGTMRNITITENFTVERVVGIGNLEAQELPTVGFTGEASCELYNIDFRKALNALEDSSVILRAADSIQQFVDTVLLNDRGVDIDIYRKVVASRATNGAVTSRNELFVSLKGAKLTQDGMTINEGQISSRNSNFVYRSAIKFVP